MSWEIQFRRSKYYQVKLNLSGTTGVFVKNIKVSRRECALSSI